MEKYLQDTEQHQALEVNYFDDNTTDQNAESSPEDAEQTTTANLRVMKNPPESLKADTGHAPRQHLSVHTSTEEKCQQPKTSKDDIDQDVEAQYLMEDTPEETILNQSDQLHTLPTSTDEVRMPTEKVGCILVISHLKQFLENYPSSSEKQAFLDVYHMLSLLDKYLYDHPKQHTHCMSSDNEYITLL